MPSVNLGHHEKWATKIFHPYGMCPFKGGVVMNRALFTAATVLALAAMMLTLPAAAGVTMAA